MRGDVRKLWFQSKIGSYFPQEAIPAQPKTPSSGNEKGEGSEIRDQWTQ